MIVSLEWLRQYVAVDVSREELESRLMKSGLNHEGTEQVGDDFAIDLEVTSNRPDCLGHIGVAREAAVLWERDLKLPAARPAETKTPVEELTGVRVDCPELCPRYLARVIRGIRVGPSPDWLARRLRTIGVAVVNNIVDITNYVLMECGQPLHAFDFGKLAGGRILVRRAGAGETFTAIDHHTYELSDQMCVIGDAERAVALGGVMGGAETEVTGGTTDLLIEAADFAPISIRNTARKLNLHSPSSYRFERGVDPAGIDWASRRCCELILELAGGELAAGVVDVGEPPSRRAPVKLRLDQLQRILGIEIPPQRVRQILARLGNQEVSFDGKQVEVIPPSWRRDLTREIDLVEEVARIHGYDAIPEDVGVPMVASKQSESDRVLAKLRHVLTAAGFDEAMTISAVRREWNDAFSPWTDKPPLTCQTPILRGADTLRRSLVPSLLAARRINETLSNARIELFEIAKVYLPQEQGLPQEEWMLTLCSGGDYGQVKGVVESIVGQLNRRVEVEATVEELPLVETGRGVRLAIFGDLFGFISQFDEASLKEFGLRTGATVAELRIAALESIADLVPQQQPLSPYPPVTRDLNMELDEAVHWADVAGIVRDCAGESLDDLELKEIYRDRQHVEPGKKRLLFTIALRSQQGTLTGEQADAVRDQIIEQLGRKHGAVLGA